LDADAGLGDRGRLGREAICLLVELGVERDDAAVRVFELSIQRPELFPDGD